MATSITLDIALINQLATQFNFNPTDFVMSAVSGSTPPTSRTHRSDFFDDLKTAEANDEGKAKAKANAKGVSPDKNLDKAAKDAKPKRAKNGYQLFCQAMRSDFEKTLQDNLAPGEKLASMDIVRGLNAKWKALNDADKGDWNAKSSLLKTSSSSETSSSSDESLDDASDVPLTPLVASPKTSRKPKPTKTPELVTVHESD